MKGKFFWSLGYKDNFTTVVRALSALGIGLILLVSAFAGRADSSAPVRATMLIVKLIAAFIFAAGIVTAYHGYRKREQGALNLMMLNAIVDIGLGLLLFFFPRIISGVIMFLIGGVLVLFGLLQLFALLSAFSFTGLRLLPLILSILSIGCGTTLMFKPDSGPLMSFVAGGALVFYGICELLSLHTVNKARKIHQNVYVHDEEDNGREILIDAKDVDFQKVEE